MHRDYFADNANDVDWLPVVAREGWIILTKDQFNWLERQAILNAVGRAFLLIPGGLTGAEQVAGALRRMLRLLQITPAPFVANYRSSEVTLISDKYPRS